MKHLILLMILLAGFDFATWLATDNAVLTSLFF